MLTEDGSSSRRSLIAQQLPEGGLTSQFYCNPKENHSLVNGKKKKIVP